MNSTFLKLKGYVIYAENKASITIICQSNVHCMDCVFLHGFLVYPPPSTAVRLLVSGLWQLTAASQETQID